MCTFVLIPQSATLLFQRATTLPFDALAHIEQLAPQVSDRSRRFGNADQGVLVHSMSRQDCKVFIGGLSWETTDEKLRTYFLNYGTVHEAFVSYDRHTGRPRGFGSSCSRTQALLTRSSLCSIPSTDGRSARKPWMF